MSSSKPKSLPAGFQLQEYTIVRSLSSGGFSFVYLALDQNDRQVAIKEYLPQALAKRNNDLCVTVADTLDRNAFQHGLRCFFEEGRVLADVHHPNIVHVVNFFRANNTVYMVMEYEIGRPLDKEISLSLKGLPEERLRTIFLDVIKGLIEVHKRDLLHLDLKPANIYLRKNGSPLLLDFGAARQALISESRLTSMYTPGFAAPEQFNKKGSLGPWTDIYGLGATMHVVMGAGVPPVAKEREVADQYQPLTERLAQVYSYKLLQLVDDCLKLNPAQRPIGLDTLVERLSEPYDPPSKEEYTGVKGTIGKWFNKITGGKRS